MSARDSHGRERAPYQLTAPDLERDASGFTVRVWFHPDISAPARAFVSVYSGRPENDTSAVALDVIETDAARALDAYRHPVTYGAHNYANALNSRPAPETDATE